MMGSRFKGGIDMMNNMMNAEIATIQNVTDRIDECVNAFKAGILGKDDMTKLGNEIIKACEDKKAENVEFNAKCEKHQNHKELIGELVSIIAKYNDLGIEVDTYKMFRFNIVFGTTPKFRVEINDDLRTVRWYAHGVVMPSAALKMAYDNAMTKYGMPLVRDVLNVYNKGGAYWDDNINTDDVVKRGYRLVKTLETLGWKSDMSEYDYLTWKGTLPEFWLECVIRAILSGAEGKMTCLSCKHAVFNEHGYARCRKSTHQVSIEDGHLAHYIEFAKTKKVYGTCVTSDVITNVTHEDCHLKDRVNRKQLCKLQELYHLYGK
jgi:hypothetical protein